MKFLKENLELVKHLAASDVWRVWRWFALISAINRGSGKEKALADFIVLMAAKFGHDYLRDESNNVLVRVAAKAEFSHYPSVCLQAHLDMVPIGQDGGKDFDTSQVKFRQEEDWLMADNTTLGSDNGIGVAISLALMESMSCGPLELLFTSSEETGMDGAIALNPDWVQSRLLINLDSEEWGEMIIGCAGGMTVEAIFSGETTKAPSDLTFKMHEVVLAGLKGGHSGADIHLPRANAILVLADLANNLMKEFPVYIVSFGGGSLKNAIPVKASFVFALADTQEGFLPAIMEAIQDGEQELKTAYQEEINLSLTLVSQEGQPARFFDDISFEKFLEGLRAIPNGVVERDEERGVTKTSNNIGVVTMEDGWKLKVVSLCRSLDNSDLESIGQKIVEVCEDFGCQVETSGKFPAWNPNYDSRLASYTKNSFDASGGNLKITVVPAGLECSMFAEKWPDMDMISIGPDIKSPHSQTEKVSVSSVEKFWDFLNSLLKNIGSLQ